jgi:hypothetical protein
MNEREPNLWEWFWSNATERVRRASDHPDPWLTWEWRVHLGQEAPQPQGEPKTLAEQRIAHNAAIARGDVAAAEHWRERIEAQLDRQVVTRFGDNLRLIGVRVVEGAEPRVEAWFEAAGQMPGDMSLSVRSTILGPSRWSLIPPDKVDRQMVSVSAIPTKLWRTGFVYEVETVLNHRIGREEYSASWVSVDGSPPPRRSDGKPETVLVVRE